MTVYILTEQGRFVDVYSTLKEAEDRKMDLYMSGANNLHIHTKAF